MKREELEKGLSDENEKKKYKADSSLVLVSSTPETTIEESTFGADNEAMNLCFGSTKIVCVILEFFDCNKFIIFLLRRLSSKFNKWLRPFVFSHVHINYRKFQEYISCHPLPFTPWRIMLQMEGENLQSDVFNRLIEHLPPSITHIKFGKHFNQSVDNLPNSIQRLVFGLEFNQPVNNLPHSIQYLEFGFLFNQPVDNLPHSIKTLVFGYL